MSAPQALVLSNCVLLAMLVSFHPHTPLAQLLRRIPWTVQQGPQSASCPVAVCFHFHYLLTISDNFFNSTSKTFIPSNLATVRQLVTWQSLIDSVALHEIRCYQKSTKLLIRKLLVHEICALTPCSTFFLLTTFSRLISVCNLPPSRLFNEAYLVLLFEDTNFYAIYVVCI